jgi:hypothetical protein
MMKNLLSR